MPLSEKAAAIVMERADLLEGESIEPLLLQLVAHVSAYKVIMRRWHEGALHEHSTIQYPEELYEWVSMDAARTSTRTISTSLQPIRLCASPLCHPAIPLPHPSCHPPRTPPPPPE